MGKAISTKSCVTKYRAKRDFAKTSEPAGKKAVLVVNGGTMPSEKFWIKTGIVDHEIYAVS